MNGNPDDEDTNERDDDRTAIVVGLIATPPDYPARVVQRLADELADLLARRVNDRARWGSGPGGVRSRRAATGGVEALLDDMARRREQEGWEVAVCLTDLPFRRPVQGEQGDQPDDERDSSRNSDRGQDLDPDTEIGEEMPLRRRHGSGVHRAGSNHRTGVASRTTACAAYRSPSSRTATPAARTLTSSLITFTPYEPVSPDMGVPSNRPAQAGWLRGLYAGRELAWWHRALMRRHAA
jgi:hypothetical protein